MVGLSRVYSDAADAIDIYGHSRGYLQDDYGGPLCIWGAIALVVDGDPRKASRKTRRMLDPLREFIRGVDPVEWNNKPTRTKAQVVNLLRKAAGRLQH